MQMSTEKFYLVWAVLHLEECLFMFRLTSENCNFCVSCHTRVHPRLLSSPSVTWLPQLPHLLSFQLLWIYTIVFCQLSLRHVRVVSTCLLPILHLETLISIYFWFFACWSDNLKSSSSIRSAVWFSVVAAQIIMILHQFQEDLGVSSKTGSSVKQDLSKRAIRFEQARNRIWTDV